MYISINACGDFGHDPAVVAAVVAAFARRIREARARDENLRGFSGPETVDGRVYYANVDLREPGYADIYEVR